MPNPEKKDLSEYLTKNKIDELTLIKDNFADYEKKPIMENIRTLLNSLYIMVDWVLVDETKKKELNLSEITTLTKTDLETFLGQVDKLKATEVELDLTTLEAKFVAINSSKKEVDDLKKSVGGGAAEVNPNTAVDQYSSPIKEVELSWQMAQIFGTNVKIDLTNPWNEVMRYWTEQNIKLNLWPNETYYWFDSKGIDGKPITFRLEVVDSWNIKFNQEWFFNNFWRKYFQPIKVRLFGLGSWWSVKDRLSWAKDKLKNVTDTIKEVSSFWDTISWFLFKK